ncbi:MAG TPA: hypothetical protein VER12_17100 [Polyangiaceae bacterium]|nr:hypothetical protein [Polyangiaceae bacterium]
MMRHSRHSTLAAIALALSFVTAFACGGSSTGGSGSNGSSAGPGKGNGSGVANGNACSGAAQCASGLCSNGHCTTGPSSVASSPGPHFSGGGPNSRALTTGCGPDTSAQCGGTCEQSGGKPATVLAPPATICYSGAGDLTPNDPSSVIEQVIETIDGKTYLHLRVTFDPRFVDNTYGVNASAGWLNKMMAGPMGGKAGAMGGKAGAMGGMAAKAAHTFDDLVGSDHVELVLVDSKGNTVLDFDVDYVSKKTDAPCGYGTLGVSGGEGKMIKGDASAIVSVATSIDRNLNGCGYCQITDSPATDDNFTANPSAPNWDYRVVYEVWVDFSTFKGQGFGGAYIPQVHASPSMASTNTIDVEPQPCPPDWDTPYCPPSVIEEGGNCFDTPPGDGTCPQGTVPDIKNEGQSCVPANY